MLENGRALLDALDRNMPIWITRAKEYRRVVEPSLLDPGRTRRTDEPAAVDHDASVSVGTSNSGSGCETGSLRKTQQDDSVDWDAVSGSPFDETVDHRDSGRDSWLVALDRCKEGVWIPRIAVRRWSEIREVGLGQRGHELENVWRTGVPPVYHDHDGTPFTERTAA